MLGAIAFFGTVLVAGCTLAYCCSPGGRVCVALAVERWIAHRRSYRCRTALEKTRTRVTMALGPYEAESQQRNFAATPIEALKDAGAKRVRWTALVDAGFASLADVLNADPEEVEAVPGIGPASVRQLLSAAYELERSVLGEPTQPPMPDDPGTAARTLIAAAVAHLDALNELEAIAKKHDEQVAQLIWKARAATAPLGFGTWFIRGVWNAPAPTDLRQARHSVAAVRNENGGDLARKVDAAVGRAGARRKTVGYDASRMYAEDGAAVRALIQRELRQHSRPAPRRRSLPPEPIEAPAAAPETTPPSTPTPPTPTPPPSLTSPRASTPPVRERPQPRSAATGHVWLPAGAAQEIAGHRISSGMVYLGSGLQAVDHDFLVEPALIDPSLSVAKRACNHSGEGIGYWPSYDEISPASRNAYLAWLAEGRRDPHAYIGYVFLFFYGLERRVLHDAPADAGATAELPAIQAEVERLSSLYGHNRSFQDYSTRFLDILSLMQGATAGEADTPSDVSSQLSPLAVKVALAKCSVAGRPIPMELALSWLRVDPGTSWRTPAVRCAVEFAELFQEQYRERFGAGLTIRPNKTPLRVSYRPASASFAREHQFGLHDLPDVTALSRPVRQIADLADQTCDALDPYSRLVGKSPDARDTPQALSLLPPALIATRSSPALEDWRSWLDDQFGDAADAVVQFDEIARRFLPDDAQSMRKKEAVSLSRLLAGLGIGIEPDARFGGSRAKPGSVAVLFRLRADAPARASHAYEAAATVLHLASLVATADDTVDDSERAHLEKHLENSLHLSGGERDRLRAHLSWLLHTPRGFSGLKRRISALRADERTEIGIFLVGVAAADGRLEPAELKSLTKLYTALGLDPGDVYSHAHEFTRRPGASDDPVVVQKRSPSTELYTVPPEPNGAPAPIQQKPSGAIELDMELVQRRMRESEAVFAVLHDIFGDEDDAPLAPSVTAVPTEPCLTGLDAAHSAALRRLCTQEEWNRAEIDEVCAALGLLPDGAVEVINDAAYDSIGDPVIEGDDPVCVDVEAVRSYML